MFDATIWTVLIAATLTAVATGLGALPFLFVRRLSLFWVSIANAAAGGLMFAATHSLVAEGVTIGPARLVAGMVIGLVGILIGRMLIVEREHASIAGLVKLDARKAMLFIGVMTAHSFAEGVGVGVSFGGSGELATFITAAIAVHNIPEGLAISLVLVPRGVPVWQAAALWSIFTSLPQPLMAVPSYLAVTAFEPFLPVGFGIAAGAMVWMVFAELIPDANKNASSNTVGITVTLAFAFMIAFNVRFGSNSTTLAEVIRPFISAVRPIATDPMARNELTRSTISSSRPRLRWPRQIRPHIGGVMPSRPTETVVASSVPSSFLLAAEMKILAPGLSSLLSAGT
jgi:zinc transporter, ZIP family